MSGAAPTFCGCFLKVIIAGIIISTLSKPALPIYAQINYMHELKGFLLAKILLFLSIGLVAAAINLFGNFLILTRSARETD